MNISADIVIPVYNEEKLLAENIEKLQEFLKVNFKHKYNIVIADNGSTDRTPDVVKPFLEGNNVTYIRLTQKGRGAALRKAWLESNADIVGYMDVDLSMNLGSFIKMVDHIIKGNCDIAVGSRLIHGSNDMRSFMRKVFSRTYNFLLRITLSIRTFSDAQCGIKVLAKTTAEKLVPLVKNQNWFFDTELLVLAEKKALRIKNIPVDWTERRKSKVNIFSAICEDVLGILRLWNKHFL